MLFLWLRRCCSIFTFPTSRHMSAGPLAYFRHCALIYAPQLCSDVSFSHSSDRFYGYCKSIAWVNGTLGRETSELARFLCLPHKRLYNHRRAFSHHALPLLYRHFKYCQMRLCTWEQPGVPFAVFATILPRHRQYLLLNRRFVWLPITPPTHFTDM